MLYVRSNGALERGRTLADVGPLTITHLGLPAVTMSICVPELRGSG
jgi:hypothetical protein